MTVLWITNLLFPEAMSKLTNSGNLKETGGWMLGSADSITSKGFVNLYVATVSKLVSKLTIVKGEKITYYIIPFGSGNTFYNEEYNHYWAEIQAQVMPDVVHIHGTEYSHGLSYIRECGSDKVVISIQGMTSVIADYYNSGLNYREIVKYLTIHDLLRGTLFKASRNFSKRGVYEIDMIKRVSHVIGRTQWDKAHVWSINPKIRYHFCNETLRNEFYNCARWSYETCDKHTIFVSQANYPVKGFHQLIKALPLIIRHYPDTQVRISGTDIVNTKKTVFRLGGYSNIIRHMIVQNKLGSHLTFVGNLDANGMIEEYLKANVFLNCSTIENSPNSIGEAQLLGTPVVSSYVGGVPDMMKGAEKYMYRFDDYELLAHTICSVFDSNSNYPNMQIEAQKRHDARVNTDTLLDIYRLILES